MKYFSAALTSSILITFFKLALSDPSSCQETIAHHLNLPP